MHSPGTQKRISRIRRRSIPEVQRAYEAGQISARRADTLLYLQPDEQRREVDRILTAQQTVARRSQLAAEIIRGYVAAGTRDLKALEHDLRCALAPSATLTLESHQTRQEGECVRLAG